MKFSMSMIKQWMKCPLSARFQYIDKLPRVQGAQASFGTCVHHALDQYIKTGSRDVATAEFLDVWENPEKLNCTPELWPPYADYKKYKDRGVALIEAYAENRKWGNTQLLESEHRFLVPFGKHEISGIVDLLEVKKTSGIPALKVVDFKTAARQPNKLTLALDIQWTAYIYATYQPEFWLGNEKDIGRYPPIENGQVLFDSLTESPRVGIWFHLDNGKEIAAGTRDEKDFMRLYRVCEEIEKAIQYEVYVPDISADSCLYCAYTEPCGVQVPTQVELTQKADLWT